MGGKEQSGSKSPEFLYAEIENFFREVYGHVDKKIRSELVEQIGGNLAEHVRLIDEYGITKISGLFNEEHVRQMQEDVAAWRSTKQWNIDRHMGFDGNSGEKYLPTSKAISEAVTTPTILSTVIAALGQHPRMNFVRTYCIDPIEPYFRRAFQWHHDGHSEIGLRVMILVSDVPDFGQAMLYCPGTHKIKWPTRSSRETQFNRDYAERFEHHVCSGKAGDVIIFNQNGIHRGRRNNTVRRDVVLFNFQPGIARNYPLPGLHPDVVAKMSSYEKAVYRTNEELYELLNENSFREELRSFRLKMGELFRASTIPTAEVRQKLANNVDATIARAGRINWGVNPDVPPYIENVTQEDIQTLRSRMSSAEVFYKTFLNTEGGVEFVETLLETILDEMQKDLHGDLDLPIRMYHPNRDQRRDNAITQTRDGIDVSYFTELTKRLASTSVEDLIQTELSNYTTMADEILVQRKRLLQELSPWLLDPVVEQEVDSLMCLAEDLQEMLGRAHSMALIRRTMLYTYLTWAKIRELYVNFVQQETPLSQILEAGKERALTVYESSIAFDMYQQAHKQQ